MLLTGQLYAVIPMFGSLAREWAVAPSAPAWLATAFSTGYAAGFLLFGPVSDRYGRRRVIVAGLAATAVTTALVAAAPGLGVAIGLRVLQGVTAAAFPPAAFAYVAERFDPDRRAPALAALTSAYLASAVVAQVAAQGVLAVAGWRVFFLASAAGFALLALAVRRVLLPDAPAENAAGSPFAVYRAVPGLLRTPGLPPLYLATTTLLTGFVGVYTGLQLAGWAPGPLLALRATALPAIVAVPLLMPWLARVPAPRRAGLGLLLAAAAAGLTALTVLTSSNVVGLALALALFSGAIAATAPAMVETVGRWAGAARGTGVSLFTFMLFAGAALGPQLAGGLAAAGGFAVVLAAVALVQAAGAAIVLVAARRAGAPAGR
ncbi:MFS transporter [Bailinhaonella thermotolerans]|uniref:MFS transporter n=1 Tax=Bailinhaonella thermotolerans TaxID=1070861 RepID=A0A3A4BC97_9ACTN|nr:MFS transporter [Bailinhaonella thermotolerans]